jgi:hypothetical protein
MGVTFDADELEQLRASFPNVGVSVPPQSAAAAALASTLALDVVVPEFTSAEERATTADGYARTLRVRLTVSVTGKSNVVTLRGVVVESEPAPSAAAGVLSELPRDDCDALARTYVGVVQGDAGSGGSGSDDTLESFVVERAADGTAVIGSGGALTALVVQVLTDATDSQLEHTLAATRLASRAPSSVSRLDVAATMARAFTSASEDESLGGSASTNVAADAEGSASDAAVAVRRSARVCVHVAKVDHMNDERAYMTAITGLVAADRAHAASAGDTGLFATLLVPDPLSPRVLLCLASLVADGDMQCAGTGVLKGLRTEIVDVDAHGRKCRERMMRDLGQFDLAVDAARLDARVMNEWRDEPLRKLAPASRDDAVAAIKQLLVAPLADCEAPAAAAASNGAPWQVKVGQILGDKTLFDHV